MKKKLFLPVYRKKPKTLEKLLTKYPDQINIHCRPFRPLLLEACTYDIECVKVVLKFNPEITNTIINYVCRFSYDILKIFIEHKVDLNTDLNHNILENPESTKLLIDLNYLKVSKELFEKSSKYSKKTFLYLLNFGYKVSNDLIFKCNTEVLDYLLTRDDIALEEKHIKYIEILGDDNRLDGYFRRLMNPLPLHEDIKSIVLEYLY